MMLMIGSKECQKGQEVFLSTGEMVILKNWAEPQYHGDWGRIHVMYCDGKKRQATYFPHVIGAVFTGPEPVPTRKTGTVEFLMEKVIGDYLPNFMDNAMTDKDIVNFIDGIYEICMAFDMNAHDYDEDDLLLKTDTYKGRLWSENYK